MICIFAFLVLIGFIFLNVNICCYFHEKICVSLKSEVQMKCLDVLLTISGVFPVLWLLSIFSYFGDIGMVLSALSIVLFVGVVSYSDYYICKQSGKSKVWEEKWTYIDKILLGLMVISSIAAYYQDKSLHMFLYLLYFDVFFLYLVFLKKIKKQGKILHEDKCIKFIEVIMGGLFYDLSWIIMGLFIFGMTISVIRSYFDPYDMDGCIDTGICKEGITFDNCSEGQSCVINKENCLKDNNIWIEDIRSCDIRHKASD